MSDIQQATSFMQTTLLMSKLRPLGLASLSLAAMAFASDVFVWRPVSMPGQLADVRTHAIRPSRGVRMSKGSRGVRTARASYPELSCDLSWGEVAASVLAGIACATAVSEAKGLKRPPNDRETFTPSWREFRARLVQKERSESSGKDAQRKPSESTGWMHSTTLIEKGSVLISRTGDQFTLDQQYFLNAVVLILKRDEGGDVGVILNRPSDWTAEDLGVPKPNALKEADLQLRKLLATLGGNVVEEQPWKVSFGGPMHSARDAEQEQPTLLCLYLCDSHREGAGEEIIPGLHWLPFSRAREMVATGAARQEDFLLLSGYCGWRRGQLQQELNVGRSWLLAAVDHQALFPGRSLQASCLDLGMSRWERLHERLFDFASMDGDGKTAAAALKRWMTDLRPALLNPSLPVSHLQPQTLRNLTAGRLLRGSSSHWILGGPIDQRPAKAAGTQPPAQYLHKAVLLVLADVTPNEPSVVVLLTGPKIGELPKGKGDVFFGGWAQPKKTHEVLQVPGGYIWGQLSFPPGRLEELLDLGAVEEVHGLSLNEVLEVPPALRWATAGGCIDSINEASAALLGNAQQKHWYRQYLGIAVEELRD
ncbi:unnamed protein product [Symbiodinium microadriaticum]|nr:unnamed protein product [Symbiodinium microadriaticum]